MRQQFTGLRLDSRGPLSLITILCNGFWMHHFVFKLLNKISLTYLLPAMFPNPWNKVSSHVEKICVKALCVCVTKSCVCVCVGQIACEGVVCHKVVFERLVCVTVRSVKK